MRNTVIKNYSQQRAYFFLDTIIDQLKRLYLRLVFLLQTFRHLTILRIVVLSLYSGLNQKVGANLPWEETQLVSRNPQPLQLSLQQPLLPDSLLHQQQNH